MSDLETLCLACNSPVKTLPNLTSLFLSIPNEMTGKRLSSNLFALPWVNLQRFYLECLLAKSGIRNSLYDAIASGKLENLNSLVIQMRHGDRPSSVKLLCVEQLRNLKSLCLRDSRSAIQIPTATLIAVTEFGIYSCKQFEGLTSTLFCDTLPLLETLTLKQCGLNSQDLITLRQANLEHRLPNLKHLDLSENEIVLTKCSYLFEKSCTWNQLLDLNIMNTICFSSSSLGEAVLDYLNTVVEGGGLSCLQRLGIDYYKNAVTIWPKLEKIRVVHCDEAVLSNIIEVRHECLPELHTLCIVRYELCDARLTRRLSEMGVLCHEFCAPWDDPFQKCHCEET